MSGNEKKLGLDEAYAVETPADNVKLYRDWADTYDSEFAQPRGYVYPQRIAEIFSRFAKAAHTPILDVGAGTGLVAQEMLQYTAEPIDAIDISQQMLDVSAEKKVYRKLLQADLKETLDIGSDTYGAIVSAGTFTHGHVGPEALHELLRISKSDALFCLGINGLAFDKYGFGSAIAELSADEKIKELQFVRVRYYENSDDEHGADQGLTAVFRKA